VAKKQKKIEIQIGIRILSERRD